MSNKILLIGNDFELNNIDYLNNIDNDNLPLKNLIITYAPLYYKNPNEIIKSFTSNMQPAITEKVEELNQCISNLNKTYKPYNIYNIGLLTIVIIFVWIIIINFLLRYIYLKYNYYYSSIMLLIIIIILGGASLWSLFTKS